MRDVGELLDSLDLAVGRAEAVAAPEVFETALARSRELRRRQGFLGETLLLAVAGGTGVGKSSLINALAGEKVASVSPLRPHTDRATAYVPEDPEPSLLLMLDELGIKERPRHGSFSDFAIVDLPDLDSVSAWHRRRVEELIPRVDGVVWVFDAEKYGDRMVHDDFLIPLAVHHDHFIFVLNKIDQLTTKQLDEIRRDLGDILVEDGYVDAEVFSLAADPPSGRRRGVDVIREYLTKRIDHKRMMLGKFAADTLLVARDLGMGGGVWDGASLDFETRWKQTRREAAARILPGRGAAAGEDALCRLEDLVALIAVEVGPDYGEVVRDVADAEGLAAIVAAATEAAASAEREAKDRRRSAIRAAMRRAAEDELDGRLGGPLAELLWDRALFGASVAHVGLAAYRIAERIRRST